MKLASNTTQSKRFSLSSFVGAAALAGALAVTSEASAAPIAECGGIDFANVTECHFEFDGGCQAQCEPLSFVAACDGQCNLDIDGGCNVECTGGCQAECEASANFDCSATCQSDCDARTAALCGSDQDCISYCQADCNQSCDFECAGTANADCTAQCDAACTGSCDVEANFDCSFSCSADLQGGCDIACTSPDGALFCDGQYVAFSNLDECVNALVDQFSVQIAFDVKVTTSCSASPGREGPAGAALAGLALAAAAVVRRRRR
jgi:MYXO-CTERM domain-containing protein